jgi:hypothetical protein
MIRALPEKLHYGAHDPDGEMCVMEAVAYVAGEPWSDHPACACPVITAFAMVINDRLGDDFRQRLLPYVPRLVNTRSTPEIELRRAYRVADWAVRRFAVEALLSASRAMLAIGLQEHADKLQGHATTLQELAPIVDEGTAAGAAGAARAAARAAGATGAAGAAGAARAAARAAGATGAAGAAGDAGAAAGAVHDLALLCLDDLLSVTA